MRWLNTRCVPSGDHRVCVTYIITRLQVLCQIFVIQLVEQSKVILDNKKQKEENNCKKEDRETCGTLGKSVLLQTNS